MQKLTYERDAGVTQYLLAILEKVQIAGTQAAQDLLTVKNLLQNPTNKDDLEKEQLEELKAKHEKKKDK